MKKILLAIFLILSLGVGYAQFEKIEKGGNISQFLLELETRKSLQNANAPINAMSMQFAPPRDVDGTMMVDAFIGIDSNGTIETLRAAGVNINCVFDGFVTAQIPLSALNRVQNLPGVNDVHVSEILKQCTDSTLKVTRAGEVLEGKPSGIPQVYDGTGVVVGIIDSGFDYQHEAFKQADDSGQSRIVRVYDPKNTSGHPVSLNGQTLPGSVFMGEQIDTLTYDIEGTHGTHTASIAAGTHQQGWGGMAPGADIVLCSSRTLNAGASEVELANCLKYIFSYADSVGKPCVVSMSMSANSGPHDGRDYFSRAIESMVGPGRIFVIAAGNNAQFGYYYAGSSITKSKPANLLMNSVLQATDDNYYYSNTRAEIWARDHTSRPQMKFHILDKRTNRIVWESDLVWTSSTFDSSSFSEYFTPDPSFSSTGYMQGKVSLDLNSDKFMISVTISNLKSKSYYVNDKGIIVSNYRIGISVLPRNCDSCYVDSWTTTGSSYFGTMTTPVYIDSIADDSTVVTVMRENFYRLPNSFASINSFAVSDSVISAGAYVARNTFFSLNRDSVIYNLGATIGNIYAPSSYQAQGFGPTGRALPTVTAPGYFVVAAGSRNSYFVTKPFHPDLVYRSENGCPWGVMSGTSMAAPTVAGIIAQWLQLKPDLSPSQVKDVIAHTAIKDEFTNISVRFGPNGKIDALAGIAYLINNNPDYVLGDANGDGQFSIGDVTAVVDYLLGSRPIVMVMPAADVTFDGRISIKDATTMIDMLLDLNANDQ